MYRKAVTQDLQLSSFIGFSTRSHYQSIEESYNRPSFVEEAYDIPTAKHIKGLNNGGLEFKCQDQCYTGRVCSSKVKHIDFNIFQFIFLRTFRFLLFPKRSKNDRKKQRYFRKNWIFFLDKVVYFAIFNNDYSYQSMQKGTTFFSNITYSPVLHF